MTTPSSRKSTRGKKAVFDLTNPRSQLAKCNDIKALVKDKVRKLSQDAQKELLMLLPACDQQYDGLHNALDANPIFWSSLNEWHDLLQSGDLKFSKRNPSSRDLQSIPWKDDNYEHFWGERMKSNKQSTEDNKPQPRQSSSQAKQQPQKTRKPKATEKPKGEKRGRKKKVVEPRPEQDVHVPVEPLKNSDDHDDTKPKDPDVKPTTNEVVRTNTATEMLMDIDTKPAVPPRTINIATDSMPTGCFGQFSIIPNKPPLVINDNNNNNTERTATKQRHLRPALSQPTVVDNDLLIFDDDEEEEENTTTNTASSSTPTKSPKRPRKTNKTAWPMNDDDFQGSDGDTSDMQAPVRKKTSRSRTVSN